MVKRINFFIGALFIFALLIYSTLISSQAQTTPLAPFTPPPPQPSQSLQFPNLFVTWDANADGETSNDNQIDKPVILRGIKNGEEVLMTNDFDFPGLENNLAIKSYPIIPQGANFAITTKVEESNAMAIGIENVTIRPILSQDANGGIKSFGKRTALTPIIDRVTGITEYSLSNHDLGDYALTVIVKQKDSSIIGGYETRLQIIPASSVQTIESEGDAVPSTIPSTTTTNTNQTFAANFLSYGNAELGIRIQYPVGWQIEEEEGEQVTFVKEKDIVEFLVDVHELDSPDITLTEYAGNEITNKREERRNFNLIESTPVAISDDVQAHKIVYTFVKEDEARFGEINKILRIYVIDGNKVYTLAYLSESDKYSTYLPIAQQMIESFRIDGPEQ